MNSQRHNYHTDSNCRSRNHTRNINRLLRRRRNTAGKNARYRPRSHTTSNQNRLTLIILKRANSFHHSNTHSHTRLSHQALATRNRTATRHRSTTSRLHQSHTPIQIRSRIPRRLHLSPLSTTTNNLKDPPGRRTNGAHNRHNDHGQRRPRRKQSITHPLRMNLPRYPHNSRHPARHSTSRASSRSTSSHSPRRTHRFSQPQSILKRTRPIF